MKQVVIFSDAGFDDIFAINHLLNHQQVRVSGIVAVPGNGNAHRAYSTLIHFFQGRTEIYEAATSVEASIHPIHGKGSVGTLAIPLVGKSGPAFSLSTLEIKDTILVSLGPLTEVAQVLRSPDARTRVKEIIAMAGNYHGPGNETPWAEYNVYLDPEAFQTILWSGIPMTIIPLDVTTDIMFHETHAEIISQAGYADYENLIRHALNHYAKLGVNGCPIHDLTAVGYVTTPDGFTTIQRHAEVLTDGAVRGRLMFDEHRYRRATPNCTIAVSADESRLRYVFMKSFTNPPPKALKKKGQTDEQAR